MPYNLPDNFLRDFSNLTNRVERIERNSGKATFVRPTTTAYLASRNDVVLADATGGVINVTLPPPAFGITVTVKRLNAGANVVNVLPNGTELIDNAASDNITSQYVSFTYISDGTNWWVI
jgi:hypothetical protein